MKEKLHRFARSLRGENKEYVKLALLCFVALLMVFSLIWTVHNIDNLNIDEILYVITNPLGDSGGGLVKSYIMWAPFAALIVTCEIVLMTFFLHDSKYSDIIKKATVAASCVLIAGSLIYFGVRAHVGKYIVNHVVKSDFVEQNYTDPASVKIEFPEKKRNLIFIYLESMETSFSDVADGGGLDKDMIPELTRLAQENEDFSGDSKELNGSYQMPGTTWTMAGMFASSTGLPLLMSIDENGMSGKQHFFPEMKALGDILQDEGYRQVFQLGSVASFGGRAAFMKDHGNFELRDYNYAKDTGLIPKDYSVFWGYEDKKLFEFSKKTLEELSQSDQPFNMTILTVDTHMPEGYICDLCRDDSEFSYFNTIACSSRQVGSFIEWVRKQDFYENTTIVITGDHITMASGVTGRLTEECDRKIYTCVINPDPSVSADTNRRKYTIFDIYPTTIGALGADIEGDRLALGTNLFSSTPTITEKVGVEEEREEIEKKSEFLSNLEKQDEDTEELVKLLSGAADPDELSVIKAENGDINLHVVSADLSEYEKETGLDKVSIKLWYYDRGECVNGTYGLDPDGKGHWIKDIGLSKYSKADKVYYQIRVHVPGYPSFNLGNEGTFEIPKEDE